MIKLRVIQPGEPNVEVCVPGDSAVLGRDKDCDIVVGAGTKSSISKRHVQILRGLVLVDLNSTNGTFVEGEKITQPTLLAGGSFNLAGKFDVEVLPEETEATPGGGATFVAPGLDDAEAVGFAQAGSEGEPADALDLVRRQLESERARAAALSGELAELRDRALRGTQETDERVAAQQKEIEDLRRRLDSLKGTLEDGEQEASESLQVRLLEQQLKELQRRNQELASRVRELEGRLGREKGAASVGEDPSAELERLRAELERARKAALPPQGLFAELMRENESLRERLRRFERGEASPTLPTTDLFLQLQEQIRVLREQLDQRSATDRQEHKEARPTLDADDVKSLRAHKAWADAEIARLRREQSSRKAPTVAASSGGAIGGVLRIVALIVEQQDVDKIGTPEGATTDEFLVLESLHFLRKAEQLLTRAARQIVQLYDQHTVLPDVGGQNFRSLTKRILADPDDADARRELSRYLAELKRWLGAVFSAQHKAAFEFACQLKQDLSEAGLTEGKPIVGLRVLPGQREAELWKRASDYLRELSSEIIEERLEVLVRREAQALLGSKEDAS